MLYLVEIQKPTGITYIREYGGNLLWEAVADAEADITDQPNSRITRIWPIDQAPDEVSIRLHSASAPSCTA